MLVHSVQDGFDSLEGLLDPTEVGAAEHFDFLFQPTEDLEDSAEIVEPSAFGPFPQVIGLPLLGPGVQGFEKEGGVCHHLLPGGVVGFLVVLEPGGQVSGDDAFLEDV